MEPLQWAMTAEAQVKEETEPMEQLAHTHPHSQGVASSMYLMMLWLTNHSICLSVPLCFCYSTFEDLQAYTLLILNSFKIRLD